MLMEMKWYDAYSMGDGAADLWGLWAMINDVYARHPEKFGSEEVRASLKQDIDEYLGKEHRNHSILEPKFYEFFVERLEHYKLQPFADISCAFVAPDDEAIAVARPLLKQFKAFDMVAGLYTDRVSYTDARKDDAPQSCHSKGDWINMDPANGPKHDYVLTGNVINDPHSDHMQVSSMVACGMITKKGGRVMHILTYGEDNPTNHVGDPMLHKLAGQELVCYDPPGRYIPNTSPYWRWQGEHTNLMVLEQRGNVVQPSRTCQLYYDYANAREEIMMHSRIKNSAGDISFTFEEYFDHFMNNPEALKALEEIGCNYISNMARKGGIAGMGWGKLSAAIYMSGFHPKDRGSISYSLLDNYVMKIDDKVPSKEVQQEIREEFSAWWDEKITAIAKEMKRTPEQKITDERFYSTGKVDEPPAKGKKNAL
jgi:hypothetical protein